MMGVRVYLYGDDIAEQMPIDYDNDRDAYEAWALATLDKAEEPWTGNLAEEGLAAEAACPYAFMAAQQKPNVPERDLAITRAIGHHVAGCVQIGLRTL